MRISDWSSDVCSSDLLFQSVGTRAVGTLIAGTDSDAMSVICLAIFLHDAQGDDVEKEGDDDQPQAKRKSGKGIGAVELLIDAPQLQHLLCYLGDDGQALYGHGGVQAHRHQADMHLPT